MKNKNSNNSDLTDKGIHNRSKKRNPQKDIKNPFVEAEKKKKLTSTRNIEIKSDKQPIEEVQSLNKKHAKHVSLNCTLEDRDRLKTLAIMNDTTMIHLVEMGVSNLVHKEDLIIKNNIEHIDQYTSIRIYPDDRSLLKKLSFKHKTTMANLISNMIDYLEERYDH